MESENASFFTFQTDDDPLPTQTAAQADLHLRILATSDLHVNILPFDYHAGAATDRLGFARTASLIETARAEAENCLLVDNGDFLQGSPLGDYIALSRGLPGGEVHPMISAMNLLRYDAGTLGNHEFNYGIDFLQSAIAGAHFPIVAANVRRAIGPHAGQTLVPAFVILERTLVDNQGAKHLVRIGVIGFTPPQITIWDQRHLAGQLATEDIVDAAQAIVPQMQSCGVDLIIALSHSGIGPGEATPRMENASAALAAIDGIDVVIAGHSHLVFPSDAFDRAEHIDPVHGTLFSKPAVMPGACGSHLGVIDLFLTRSSGKFNLLHHRSEARPIWHRDSANRETALVESHPGVVALCFAIHQDVLDWAAKPIGKTSVPLHSFFALLTESPALQLVAAAQKLHVEKRLAHTAMAHLPVLASVAPFKAGGRGGPENYTDVPVGEIVLRHASDLYIHPNSSSAIRLSGAEIADWLEFAAGIFNRVPQGSVDMPLINPDFPSFNFDMIFGLEFRIDLAAPPRFDARGTLVNPESHRIVGLTYDNAPLDLTADFAIATNSYRVAAMGLYIPPDAQRMIYQSSESHLDLVQRYFATGQDRPPAAASSRHFVSMPGTSVTFDTSPKAAAHLTDLAGLKIDIIGPIATGFLRFRLHL